MEQVAEKYPGDFEKMKVLSIVEEGSPKRLRMANLSIVGSHKINGVAAVHSGLIKTDLFKDFYEMFPSKFTNKTNGVTIRRWVNQCNPGISKLFTELVGDESLLKDMTILAEKEETIVNDLTFHQRWRQSKQESKEQLANMLHEMLGVTVNTKSLFDIQIKRIHEYKRQLMLALFCIHRYLAIKEMAPTERVQMLPRTVIFGGKAAPGYDMANKIIH